MSGKDVVATSAITNPHWVGVFFAIAVVSSLIPFFVGFLMGMTVASDVVFGFYALIGGIASYFVMKWAFQRKLVLLKQPEISFLSAWIALTTYVIVFRPFE